MLDAQRERRALEQEQREDRLRWLILRHDALASALAVNDEDIRLVSREWADVEGIKVRPTIDQLAERLKLTGRRRGGSDERTP